MIEEEKEAIKILNTISEKEQGQRVFWEEDLKNIRIVLNLIQKQQEEIEKLRNKNKDLHSTYKEEFSRLNAIIQRKNRQIDLMAFSLADYVMYYEYDKCRNPEMIKSKAEEINQYFEKQAKEVEENEKM